MSKMKYGEGKLKTPKYKIFNAIKNAINDDDYQAATQLIDSVKPELSKVHDKALCSAYESMIGEKRSGKPNPVYQDGRLSRYDERNIIPGVSIVSCCMNRNDNLKRALRSWLRLPVDEIVIVDWSSDTKVEDTISDIKDDRIKIVRVENEPRWILTYGFNVGLRFASYSKVYKFDADIEVSEDFLHLNDIYENQFVRGSWKSALDEGLDSQVYVNGSFGAYKKHLKEIGYYNEMIRTYGWDDSDIYERLSSHCGLETTYLDQKSILHMEQKEEDRISNQDVVKSHFLGLVPPTEFNNHRNKYLGRTTDFWSSDRVQDYSIEQVGSSSWICKRVSKDIQIPTYTYDNADIFASSHFVWTQRPQLFSGQKDIRGMASFLTNEYKAKVDFEITLSLLGEYKKKHTVSVLDGKNSLQSYLIKNAQKLSSTSKLNFLLLSSDEFSHSSRAFGPVRLEIITLPDNMVNAINVLRAKNGLNGLELNGLEKVKTESIKSILDRHATKRVYVDAQHGLGNRLRAIGSAAAIAKAESRELVIVWEPDHHCECQFSDLFDYNGPVIEKSFLGEAKENMAVFNYMEIEDGANKDQEVVVSDDKDLYLRAAYTFNSQHSTWDVENQLLKSLTPSKTVLDLIKDFDLSNCIAAHVRMEAGAGLDHNTYDSVENWTQEGHDQLHYWREKSHYSHFIKRIDQIFSEDSNLKLFLATDMPETYKVFEEYYGDRLIYLERDVYDRSKEQIIYGLADALLLSKAQKLLGSTWSSFSELAMRMSTTYSLIEMSGKDF